MNSAARDEETRGGGRRGDTRQRIQRIALKLFAEQGYERTSLREIAERLGVTKAALYYHFKSKEDIVGSFTEDYLSRLDELVEWAKEQPRTAVTAEEVLDRYIGIVVESREVFRFLERNQAMLHGSDNGSAGSGSSGGGSGGGSAGSGAGGGSGNGKHHRLEQFRPRMNALVETIVGPDAPARSRVRATAAFFAVSVSCMFFMPEPPSGPGADCLAAFEPVADLEELRKIVVELADDIVRGI